MSENHLLKTLLNIHLLSDNSATIHLPFVLKSVTADSLSPSPHLSKWITRIQALLHSKDVGGRWAGLLLAQKTAILSHTLLLENAQSWVGIALPLLSKNEPIVVLKAAIRLLRTIFSRLHEVAEFRRQVATPSVPKLATALSTLVENNDNIELRVTALSTLAYLASIYPTLHKPSYLSLSNLALRFLDGHPQISVAPNVLLAASRLYSILHITGGKVGASNLWRKTFEETLAFGTNAFWSLRTTFAESVPPNVSVTTGDDPVLTVPLNVDRLKCAVTILDELLGATVYRPVQIPLGATIKFALQLLRAAGNAKQVDGYVDSTRHMLEISAARQIQEFGCSLVITLTERLDKHLQPYLNQISTVLAIHIEQKYTLDRKFVFLKTLESVMRHYHSCHSPILATRLMKATLPCVTHILAVPENLSNNTNAPSSSRSKKGKKKALIFGDEGLLSASRPVICPMDIDGQVLLTALEVIHLILHDPHLSSTMQSISIRVLISLLLVITHIPPTVLSPNTSLYQDVLAKLHSTSVNFITGTSSTLSKSLPIIVDAIIRQNSSIVHQRQLDLLLHPRLPPLVRSMPLTESLALLYSEESQEESELRRGLGILTRQEEVVQEEDTVMQDQVASQTTSQTTILPTSAQQYSFMQQQEATKAASLPSSQAEHQATIPPPRTVVAKDKEVESTLPHTASTSIVIGPSKIPTIEPAAKAMEVPPRGEASRMRETFVHVTEEDDDEEMPAIDMESDSDIE